MNTTPPNTSPDMWRNLSSLAGHRVVFLNWRDPLHPAAGGAEVYCWEIASRWAAAGAQVALLTSAVAGRPAYEVVSGVEIYRAGGRFSLYPRALSRLGTRFRDADIVIDFQNGIPFFAPLLAGPQTAVVLVFHHVHQDQFRLHLPGPLSTLGRFMEGPASRRIYGRRPVVAVSPSTRTAVRLRLGLSGPVFVVPNGTPAIPATSTGRSPVPRLAAVGRLVAHKRVDLLIQAAAALRERYPTLQVDIVGDGPERPHLAAMIAALGLADVVHLHGRLDELAKADRFAGAWLHVQPSQGEGWGITVLEAAAHGVPSLSFNVPGLRDAIRPGRTGWVLDGAESLSTGIDRALGALQDQATVDYMSAGCRAWARSFTWDESADRLAGVALAERAHRLLGIPEQRVSDTACVVRLDGVTEEELRRLRDTLRRTDVITAVPGSGRAQILLYGSDEEAASAALARAGVYRPATFGPAGTEDLLAAAHLSLDASDYMDAQYAQEQVPEQTR